jgi:hypothetical protein
LQWGTRLLLHVPRHWLQAVTNWTQELKKQKLILPVAPLYGIDELLRVEADAVFEDDLDILDI